jgi:hypothetical protein
MQNNGKQENQKLMKLFEHPDFTQAIIRAARHFRSQGIREAIIEKDYFVTEALRIINHTAGKRVIFKGGTSLSKGWNIIQRFSEDIDIFFNPTFTEHVLGKHAIDRELKRVRSSIEEHPALVFIKDDSKTIGGFGRSDYFEYPQRFASTGEIRNRLLVELGSASGKEPTEKVKLQSYLGRFLEETTLSLGAEDEGAFEMQLLHFRRTFVEKLFAIHAKVEVLKNTGRSIGSYARHYYDLFCLAQRSEVIQMLQSDEYEIIKDDYDKVSSVYFKQSYIAPPNMSFMNSDALFPPSGLDALLSGEFEKQCKILCFGKIPSWDQVRKTFFEIRELL